MYEVLSDEVAVLLSALAQLGNRTACCQEGVAAGHPCVNLRDRTIRLLEAGQCLRSSKIRNEKTRDLFAAGKKRMLSTATLCIVADGLVSVAEAGLLEPLRFRSTAPYRPSFPEL